MKEAQAPSRSVKQLAEFLSVVSSYADETRALRGALEMAAEVFEAEAAALFRGSGAVAIVGFPHERIAFTDFVAVLEGKSDGLAADGEAFATMVVQLEDVPPGRMMIARAADKPFDEADTELARGMARVIALTVRSARMLDSERRLREESQRHETENARLLGEVQERQTLLERLAKIQRSISHRVDLQEVLDSITAGAQELLGDEMVGLRLADPEDPNFLLLVSEVGVPASIRASLRRTPVDSGAGGRAMREGRLVVVEGYEQSPHAMPQFKEEHLQAAMAAPVHENGTVIGSLVVATHRPGRVYTKAERDMLRAFAEHASIALTDARTMETKLYEAMHDGLTRLPNRALFTDRLRHALAGARREPRIAVLSINLDRFKIINDSFGVQAGDDVLCEIAARLQRCLRAGDTAARFGGDEFGLLVEDVLRPSDVAPIAERVLDSLRAPFEIEGTQISLSASIGVALATETDSADELLRMATVAMHEAKQRGRDRTELFEQGMHTSLVARIELESDLRRALDNDEFVLHYQPIVSLETGEITSFEALIRWAHPTRGMLAPDQFISTAEDVGLIVPLGRWVMERACKDLATWQRRFKKAISVSVNLSTRELQQTQLVAEVADVLGHSPVAEGSLILEITETGLVQDTETMIMRLERLRSLGVRIAIDDFGTGYSSLSYLRRFPIDIIKIDRSFVEGVALGPEDGALAHAIVKLGETLGIQTVAEGVETAEQRDTLRALKCPYAQGYYFSRPVEAKAVPGMLTHKGSRAFAFGRLRPAIPARNDLQRSPATLE